MKRIIGNCIGAGLLLLCTTAAGNETVNHYIAEARELPAWQSESLTTTTNLFDQPELRYSGNDNDEQGIAFRFRPRFAAERMAQGRVIELLNRQHSGLLEASLNDALHPRYLRLLDLIQIHSENDHRRAVRDLNRQRLDLHQSQVETEDFSIAALQAAEFDYQQARQMADQYGIRLQRQLRMFVGIPQPGLQEFLQDWTQQVIGWDGIIDTSLRLSRSINDGQLDDDLERIDFELAQQKLKLARSDSASWLKFVELKYVERSGGDQETSLGFSIPLGSNSAGISQRAAEVNRANISLQQNRIRMTRSLSATTPDLIWLRDQAKLLDSSLALLKRQHSLLHDANQIALSLKLQSAIQENRNQTLKLKLRGLRAYIDMLHSVGSLAQMPLSNWLLQHQPRL
ncbi:hypothetical protein N8198_01730 [Gammaproteobacteria bacterium]|nr:hypothetical protein [Gammaproteobacteria bacterium]